MLHATTLITFDTHMVYYYVMILHKYPPTSLRQRLYVALHGTLGSYLRDPLREGNANDVACLEVALIETRCKATIPRRMTSTNLLPGA
jgi:hypothetical protein